MNTATIAPLATFATFVIISKSTGQPLNTEAAYTSLSLIYLLSNPMVIVFRTIPFVSAALACFSRIQTYLLSESCIDYRLPFSEGNQHCTPDDGKGEIIVAMSGASFGWTPGKPDILTGVTINIRRSSFIFVVGPVGSGKSTLMRAILGEVPLRAGSVHVNPGNMAFVGQEPWVQNLTIRQNVLGSTSYDVEWYGKVLYACGLEQDICDLPNGDATRAGSAGFSLSGGQKQRLALARAVYSREKTVLLDDVFAGQDAATEEHIFQVLFAETGLFRQMGVTVVCATNAIYRLSYADHVVALDLSGHIVHQGSFNQLQSDTDYLHGLAVKQNGAINGQNMVEVSAQHHDETVPDRRPETEDDLISADSVSPGRVLGEFTTYAYYFGSVPIWHTILFAALVIVYAGGFRMTALVLSFWTDTAEESAQTTNDYFLGLFGMLTGLAVVGITGAAYIFLVVMVPLSSEVLHARLLESVINAPVAFFSRTDVGVTINRFSQDMSIIDTELPFALVDFCVNFALIIMSVVLMCVFSGYFAAAIAPFFGFCWRKFQLPTLQPFDMTVRCHDSEAELI